MKLLRRFIIRDKGGGFWGVWDIDRQAYRLHPEFGFADDPETAQAEADRLEDEIAVAGFQDFLRAGIVYRFKREQITQFQKGFNGWIRREKLPVRKTEPGFDRLYGFTLRLLPEEEPGHAERTDQIPPVRARRGKGASSARG